MAGIVNINIGTSSSPQQGSPDLAPSNPDGDQQGDQSTYTEQPPNVWDRLKFGVNGYVKGDWVVILSSVVGAVALSTAASAVLPAAGMSAMVVGVLSTAVGGSGGGELTLRLMSEVNERFGWFNNQYKSQWETYGERGDWGGLAAAYAQQIAMNAVMSMGLGLGGKLLGAGAQRLVHHQNLIGAAARGLKGVGGVFEKITTGRMRWKTVGEMFEETNEYFLEVINPTLARLGSMVMGNGGRVRVNRQGAFGTPLRPPQADFGGQVGGQMASVVSGAMPGVLGALIFFSENADAAIGSDGSGVVLGAAVLGAIVGKGVKTVWDSHGKNDHSKWESTVNSLKEGRLDAKSLNRHHRPSELHEIANALATELREGAPKANAPLLAALTALDLPAGVSKTEKEGRVKDLLLYALMVRQKENLVPKDGCNLGSIRVASAHKDYKVSKDFVGVLIAGRPLAKSATAVKRATRALYYSLTDGGGVAVANALRAVMNDYYGPSDSYYYNKADLTTLGLDHAWDKSPEGFKRLVESLSDRQRGSFLRDWHRASYGLHPTSPRPDRLWIATGPTGFSSRGDIVSGLQIFDKDSYKDWCVGKQLATYPRICATCNNKTQTYIVQESKDFAGPHTDTKVIPLFVNGRVMGVGDGVIKVRRERSEASEKLWGATSNHGQAWPGVAAVMQEVCVKKHQQALSEGQGEPVTLVMIGGRGDQLRSMEVLTEQEYADSDESSNGRFPYVRFSSSADGGTREVADHGNWSRDILAYKLIGEGVVTDPQSVVSAVRADVVLTVEQQAFAEATAILTADIHGSRAEYAHRLFSLLEQPGVQDQFNALCAQMIEEAPGDGGDVFYRPNICPRGRGTHGTYTGSV